MVAATGQADELKEERRFAFGENWRRFLATVDEERIEAATRSLRELLGSDRLDGVRFLDVGSGSGLFSLAAHRLGARVHSFDYDEQSVECTRELKRRYRREGPEWTVERGSVLDDDYMRGLGEFDVVYSWGVLHHTGEMWRAVGNALRPLRPGGTAVLALYNNQGWISSYWSAVKRTYNANALGRALVMAVHVPYLVGARALFRWIRGKGAPDRGMSLWYDARDWLGGWPFEVASPEEVATVAATHGLTLRAGIYVGRRHGCNQFVFERAGAA